MGSKSAIFLRLALRLRLIQQVRAISQPVFEASAYRTFPIFCSKHGTDEYDFISAKIAIHTPVQVEYSQVILYVSVAIT